MTETVRRENKAAHEIRTGPSQRDKRRTAEVDTKRTADPRKRDPDRGPPNKKELP